MGAQVETAPGIIVRCSNCRRELGQALASGKFWCWRCGLWTEAKTTLNEVTQ